MTEERYSITIGSHILSYRLAPYWTGHKNPKSPEEINESLTQIFKKNPSLQPRAFTKGLFAIEDLTIAEARSGGVALSSRNMNKSPWDDFLNFLNSGASENEAQQWLVKNLSRFDQEQQKTLLLAFYELARKERDGESTEEDMTFKEFKEACREMEQMFGGKHQD